MCVIATKWATMFLGVRQPLQLVCLFTVMLDELGIGDGRFFRGGRYLGIFRPPEWELRENAEGNWPRMVVRGQRANWNHVPRI